MYNSNKQKFFLYQYDNCGFSLIKTFYSHGELIKFLSLYQSAEPQYVDKKLVYNNRYLDYINLTYNDTYSVYDIFSKQTYLRQYMFFDKNYAVVDVRKFIKEILYTANHSKRNYYSRNSWRISRATGYEFRRTPIPYTGKRVSSVCRNIKIGRIIRDFKNPENKNYIRKKYYYNIEEVCYDYPFKNKSKSWKDQSKKKHQWEKA